MQKYSNKIFWLLSIIIIGIIFGLGIGLVKAWIEPKESPPSGNLPAPINVGSLGQTKAGGLILNTGGAAYGLIVATGSVGIGVTQPSEKLDVDGNLKVGDYIYLGQSAIEGDFTFVCSNKTEWTNKKYCAWKYIDPNGVTYYYDDDNNGFPPPCGEPVTSPISLPSVNTMQTIINEMGVRKQGAYLSKNHVIKVISMTQPTGAHFCGGGGTDGTTATVKILYKQPYILMK